MSWHCHKHGKDSVDDECPVCKREYYNWIIPQEYLDSTQEISLLKNRISALGEPWCYEGGGQAQMGECPTHHGDACLRTPEGLVTMIQNYDKLTTYHNIEYSSHVDLPDPYDPKFGDEKICTCGHPYHRHFDSYEDMRPAGCKYCQCYTFNEADEIRERAFSYINDPTVAQDTSDIIKGLLELLDKPAGIGGN